ncbi:MAG: hypothetical protein CMF49_02170 [Legionellales bacterium]|nr:hypothetical protein [Legionellales bacterium]|tara:strand:- start:19 stop:489 length:471 start_codon:yes stop_codon:yes gene_type:complete
MLRFIVVLVLALMTLALQANTTDAEMTEMNKSGVVEANITLNASEQSWYIFHNDGLQTVFINQFNEHPSASAGWGTKLSYNKYAMLALNNRKLVFYCGILEDKTFKTIPCNKYIHISKVLSATVRHGTAGSFWVAEDVTLQQLKDKAAKRDIVVNY